MDMQGEIQMSLQTLSEKLKQHHYSGAKKPTRVKSRVICNTMEAIAAVTAEQDPELA